MPAAMLAEENAGALAGVYAEIRAGFGLGLVPNVFKAMAAHHPDVLVQNWTALRQTVLEGDLPLRLKQLIGMVVAREHASKYLQAFSTIWLRGSGAPEALIRQIRETGEAREATTATRVVLRFAADYSRNPDTADSDDLYRVGLSEDEVQEVVDAILVAAGIARFADESDLPLDVAVAPGA